MPRLMSFAKTVDQIRNRTKTVTRRDGWGWLEPGTILWACEKTMVLQKGETATKICKIRVDDVQREEVRDVLCTTCDGNGKRNGVDEEHDCEVCGGTGASPSDDVERKDFDDMTGAEFVEFFKSELGVAPGDMITRIEFRYLKNEAENDE